MSNTSPSASGADTEDQPDALEVPDGAAQTSSGGSAEASSGGSGETLGAADPNNSAVKDPEDWVTGDEPMTAAQRSYLDTLAREAGEEISADLTKAQASEEIERLQQKSGRGA
jgi:hypothetical protein